MSMQQSIFPEEVWSLIATKCKAQTFLALEAGLPELRDALPSAIKKKVLFKDVLSIMYRQGFVDFADISSLKMVCVGFYNSIRDMFSEANLDSVENRHMEKERTSVVVWLPMRHTDQERLLDMKATVENGIMRCPALSGTLIVKYPRYKKNECLPKLEMRQFLHSITDLLKLFTSLEFQKSEEAHSVFINQRGRYTQEFRDLMEAGGIWDAKIRLLHDFTWIAPYFETMSNLKSVNCQDACLGQCVNDMLAVENLSNLKCLTLGVLCECRNVSARLIDNCRQSLELISINNWNVAHRLLVNNVCPKTLELKFRLLTLDEGEGCDQFASLLRRQDFLPSLERIIIVFDYLRFSGFQFAFERLLKSLRKRKQLIRLFKCQDFSTLEDLEEVPLKAART